MRPWAILLHLLKNTNPSIHEVINTTKNKFDSHSSIHAVNILRKILSGFGHRLARDTFELATWVRIRWRQLCVFTCELPFSYEFLLFWQA